MERVKTFDEAFQIVKGIANFPKDGMSEKEIDALKTIITYVELCTE